MPKHEVVISNPNKSVLASDVEFVIKSDGKKLGTLLLSKGNVEWRPARHSATKHRHSWENFAKIMTEGKIQKAKSARKLAPTSTKLP
jgi:hypothetical protein